MNLHRFDEFVADHFLEYVEKTSDQNGADEKTNDFGWLRERDNLYTPNHVKRMMENMIEDEKKGEIG